MLTEKEDENSPGPSNTCLSDKGITAESSVVGQDIHIYLPNFSDKIKALLESGRILNEWDKFVEECGYHVLSVGNFDSKEQYNKLGWLIHKKYPCIAFAGGKHPWVFYFLFCKIHEIIKCEFSLMHQKITTGRD